MQVVSARNPEYTPHGIELLVTFEGLGEVPFHATPTDTEPHGRDIFSRALNGEFGAIAAYVVDESIHVPASVTPRQAKLALLSAGLLDAVEAAIEAIADASTKRVAQIEWEYAQEVRRDCPQLNAVAAQMGMTDAQLDELFTLAATL